MDKALEMGQTSATGSFRLFIGKITSTVILAVGTIVLGSFISGGDYGLYAIALIPATTLLLFQDWGIGAAMTKNCANYRALNKEGELRSIIVSGLVFEAATGTVLTLCSLLIANFVAFVIFGKPESAFLVSIASVTILSAALFAAAQSVFIGFERMGLGSISSICQAVVQCAIGPLLVYLGYGALGATIGYTVASVVSSIFALVLVYLSIFRKLRFEKNLGLNVHETLMPMLRYGIPLAISVILSGVLLQFYSFMVASYCDVVIIGHYRIAANFALLLTFFTSPITTVLFPAFSKLETKKEGQLLKTVFVSSVKYTVLFLIPATMAIMVLSKPLVGTLYGDKWFYSPAFLTLSAIANLFAISGNLSMNALLYAAGETKILVKINIMALSIGIPLGFLLIPTFGIIGLILSSLLAGLPSMFWGLHWIWKHYRVKADFKSSTKIFAASAVAALATYASLNFVNLAEWIRLVIGITIFLAIYIFTAPTIGALTQTDITNLRIMLSGFGILSRPINKLLTIIERIAKRASGYKE